jgi:hypothetical protein
MGMVTTTRDRARQQRGGGRRDDLRTASAGTSWERADAPGMTASGSAVPRSRTAGLFGAPPARSAAPRRSPQGVREPAAGAAARGLRDSSSGAAPRGLRRSPGEPASRRLPGSPSRPAARPAPPRAPRSAGSSPAGPRAAASPAPVRARALGQVSRASVSVAPRAPFLMLVLCLLGGGLVCLLVINTTLGAASFQIDKLQQTANARTLQVQRLQQQIATDTSPTRLAQEACQLGMRPQRRLAYLNVRSRKVLTEPAGIASQTAQAGCRR